jgi:hypothetical protein
MPTLDEDGWELDNAEELHARYPAKFHIPSRQERASLQVGARVKLVFLLRTQWKGEPIIHGERMWCTIREVLGERYVGMLDSDPATSQVLKPGDRIEFGPEHVATVLIPRTDPRRTPITARDKLAVG